MEIDELKGFADHIKPMTCIISVERFSDGSYGNIRIVTGNEAYLNATEEYMNVGREDMFRVEFVPDQPYERYIPKDLNFEEYCYRCAFGGELLHTYVRPDIYQFWIHMNMVPIKSDCENIGYCTYTQEFTKEADASLMASLSPEMSVRVLRTCIELRGAKDFRSAAEKVIADIGELTSAEHCCIFLTDFGQRKCSVLCESLKEGISLLPMDTYVDDDFIDIAATWDGTIAGSTCLIVNDAHDWEELKKRNPVWYESMHSAGAKSLVLFPQTQADILKLLVGNFLAGALVRIQEAGFLQLKHFGFLRQALEEAQPEIPVFYALVKLLVKTFPQIQIVLRFAKKAADIQTIAG